MSICLVCGGEDGDHKEWCQWRQAAPSVSPDAPERGNVHRLPKMPEFVRICFRGGHAFVDVQQANDFHLPAFIASLRGNGYFLNNIVYIPLDAIETVFTWRSDAKPNADGTVIHFPEPKKP